MAIVMGAMGSVFVLTARALPDGQPATQSQAAAAALMQRLGAELQCATSITAAGPTFIEFVTTDRTGDSVADTIRYDWNGLLGGAVTRTLNGGTAGIVLNNVKRFVLGLQVQTETVQPAAEPSEVLLASYDSTAWNGAQLSNVLWRGAMVLPALSVDATSYRITRVALNLKVGTKTDPATTVAIYAVDSDGLPNGSALASTTISAASIGAASGWHTATFASPPTLSADRGFAFMASGVGSNGGGRITTVISDGAPPRAQSISTINAGSSWTKGGKDLPNFQVYGKVYNQTATPGTRRFLTRVSVEAQINTAGSPLLSGGISLANQPEVP